MASSPKVPSMMGWAESTLGRPTRATKRRRLRCFMTIGGGLRWATVPNVLMISMSYYYDLT
jgi:hypothetical protein